MHGFDLSMLFETTTYFLTIPDHFGYIPHGCATATAGACCQLMLGEVPPRDPGTTCKISQSVVSPK